MWDLIIGVVFGSLFLWGLSGIFVIVFEYLFGRYSYHYYWKYWNPFLKIPWEGKTLNLISLLFFRWFIIIFFIYLFVTFKQYSKTDDYGYVWVLIPCFIISYGVSVFSICAENDTKGTVTILKDMQNNSKKNEKKPIKRVRKIKKNKIDNVSETTELIKKLSTLRDKGILTQKEFDDKKSDLLKRL
tara:strand:+ start:125 stop:682 length:558 start_codon:yes stop_codon:yes gene_type:complete